MSPSLCKKGFEPAVSLEYTGLLDLEDEYSKCGLGTYNFMGVMDYDGSAIYIQSQKDYESCRKITAVYNLGPSVLLRDYNWGNKWLATVMIISLEYDIPFYIIRVLNILF